MYSTCLSSKMFMPGQDYEKKKSHNKLVSLGSRFHDNTCCIAVCHSHTFMLVVKHLHRCGESAEAVRTVTVRLLLSGDETPDAVVHRRCIYELSHVHTSCAVIQPNAWTDSSHELKERP